MALDLGTFVFFNFLGFMTFLLSFLIKNPIAGVFSVVAMILFFGIALLVLTGDIIIQESGTTELTYNGTGSLIANTTTADKQIIVIPGDYNIILNAVYLGLGTFNLILFAQRKWAVFG